MVKACLLGELDSGLGVVRVRYGHLDDKLWEAARAVGGILGASEPSEPEDTGADEGEAGESAS